VKLETGSQLGPYKIQVSIGAGGMGEVFRALDPRLGREVAVKVLPSRVVSDPEHLQRFEQEARAVGALNHPNIMSVFDFGTHDGAPYVVFELLEGETLRQRLGGTALPVRKALDYSAQIARGLAAAHERGIVHRDLKPENLFITRDGRIKILDFGLAKLTQSEEGGGATNMPTAAKGTEPGVVLGTLGYMAPEQVRGRPTDARSDIFSFGAILYEMLSGKRAFGSFARQRCRTASRRLTSGAAPARLNGSFTVASIISRAVAPRKGRRPRSASAIRTPSEKMSVRSSISPPETCSGAM